MRVNLSAVAGHGGILLRGAVKSLYGAAVVGLIGLAIYGFASIPAEGGYTAVCDFIGAAASLAVALSAMYAFGGRRQKKSVGRYAAGRCGRG